MIGITDRAIRPELVIEQVKIGNSGCVFIFIGLIREHSRGKLVHSVEFDDRGGTAETRLQELASEVRRKWTLNNIALLHRIGELKPGDINSMVAIASTHHQEGLAAFQYVAEQLKRIRPAHKKETYQDGSVWVEEK